MLLIRYLHDFTLPSEDEVVVATSMADKSAYYILRGKTLVAIPSQIVVSKIYPQGIVDPPRIDKWLEENPDIATDLDWSLMDLYLNPVLH